MHIYFSGIGGAAIGPLALVARDAGYRVSGSDLSESLITDEVRATGLEFAIGQDGTHIAAVHAKAPIDWLVISSAVPPDHPEVQFAHKAGIKISKRAELINLILERERLKLVAVAGTHGKTTTTAMLVWLFKQFGIPASYSIGSRLSFGRSGSYQPGSTCFVYECDEYDRNMLAFSPAVSLVNNVDYDHPDTYPTRGDYNSAFIEFVHQSQTVLMWYADVARLSLEKQCDVVLDAADPHIASISLAGQHNRQNAWAAVQTFLALFPDRLLDDVIAKVSSFPGTERRFERLAPNVYTDYAHHPSEIRATLQLARELHDIVIAVYQPHQNIRQHQIAHEYQDCFKEATHIYWLPTYLTREDPDLETLTPTQLISRLSEPGIAEAAEMDNALVDKLHQHQANGELIVFMGAGTIDAWARGLFKR